MTRRKPEPSVESLVEEAARRAAAALIEVVPPEAVLHLLNAQREFLRAVTSVVEHNLARASGSPAGGSRARRRRPSRVDLD